jgi:hypothetical protein
MRATITFPGGEFAVRGLGLADIVELVRENADVVRRLFAAFQGDAQAAMLDAMVAAPDLLDAVIRRAADRELPENLPLSIQIEALQHIGDLTFVGEGAVGNLLAVAERAVAALNAKAISTPG